MSKYTTELRYVCEVLAGLDESEGYNSVDDIIENSYDKLFDFSYPIFDEAYRPILEKKIIRHFYTREIGDETVGLFKLHLSAKMNDIMDYYNQLYKSALIEFDPMTDINYSLSGTESASHSESHSSSNSGNHSQSYSESYSNSAFASNSENSSSSLSTSESNYESEIHSNSMWNMYQDTPQNQLNGVESLEYLTNATLDKDHGNNERNSRNAVNSIGTGNLIGRNDSNDTGNKTNNESGVESKHEFSRGTKDDIKSYLEKYVGYRNNNPSKLLADYRDTFLNIDLMIIGELEKLFFQLW